MINIDVLVPSISKRYEFTVNENVKCMICADEFAELICQKEGYQMENSGALAMLNQQDLRILNMSYTLRENRIVNGDTIILI